MKFEDDQIFICSPNNVIIALREENVEISIDSKTKINFSPEGVFVKEMGKEDDSLKVNLLTVVKKDEDVIVDYKHFTGEAKVLGNGQIQTRLSIGLDPDIEPKTIKEKKRKFSLRFSGQEELTEEKEVEIDEVEHEPKIQMLQGECIFRPDDHNVRNALLFHPSFFVDSDESGYGFEMHTQKHLERKFPDKDQALVVVFKDVVHLNPIYTLKDFKMPLTNEISKTTRTIECDIVDATAKILNEFKGKPFGYSCFFMSKEADLKHYLLDLYDDINLRITIIIDDCLRRRIESENLKHKKVRSNCEKIRGYREKLEERKYRQAIYQGMLFTKTFPNYHTFKDASGDIRTFNVCKVVDEIKTKTEKIVKMKL